MSWCISKPFDTLLLKYWSRNDIRTLIGSLSGSISDSQIAEVLIPDKPKVTYFEHDILITVFDELLKKPNACDNFQFCQDVHRHSAGFACVTAAGIRKRLFLKFPERIGTIDNLTFQNNIIIRLKNNQKRKNIGVLIFDCPNDGGNIREHIITVLLDNFYVYQTPRMEFSNEEIDLPYLNRIEQFVFQQISRNTDCVIIFIDHQMTNIWSGNSYIKKILLNSIRWNFKIKIIFISVNKNSDPTAIDMFTSLITLKPILITYDKLIMAPSGGLITLIEKSCKLNFQEAFLKYYYRGIQILCGIKFDSALNEGDQVQLV